MPRISSFYGIVVRMYWNERDHPVPHFHTQYGDESASVGVDGTVLDGQLPPRALRMTRQWAHLHRADLLLNWDRARRHEPFVQIDPLA